LSLLARLPRLERGACGLEEDKALFNYVKSITYKH